MANNHPFMGSALNAVDAKGRVSLYAPFRELIAVRCSTYAPGDVSVDDKQIALTLAAEMDRLIAYDAIGGRERAQALRDSVADLPAAERPKALAKLGRGMGNATPANFDSAGRFVLPQTLRKLVGITDHVVFWGGIDYFEIWDPARLRHALADEPADRAIVESMMAEKGIAL